MRRFVVVLPILVEEMQIDRCTSRREARVEVPIEAENEDHAVAIVSAALHAAIAKGRVPRAV